MMTDSQILELIDERIDRKINSPNVIIRPKQIEALARRQAYEVMQPEVDYLQTSDATPTTIRTIEIADGEAGMVETHILAIKIDGTVASTFHYIYHYYKTGGALTTIVQEESELDGLAVSPIVIDNDGSDNIKIELTGLAATDIEWNVYTNQKKIIATGV